MYRVSNFFYIPQHLHDEASVFFQTVEFRFDGTFFLTTGAPKVSRTCQETRPVFVKEQKMQGWRSWMKPRGGLGNFNKSPAVGFFPSYSKYVQFELRKQVRAFGRSETKQPLRPCFCMQRCFQERIALAFEFRSELTVCLGRLFLIFCLVAVLLWLWGGNMK